MLRFSESDRVMTIERREIRDRQEWLQWRMGDITASDVQMRRLLRNPSRTMVRTGWTAVLK
jgi:hypothetical protein